MNAQTQRRPSELAQPAEDTPLLRTLLMTDLCDSTEIVERIGDTASAQLFRQHDKLVLELQQRWRGRLIDRSDGLLLLFERPIDGLGFALDYMKSLKPLGDANKIELHARAGLHVGEVLTWRNSVEAVQQGAKSMEVEGLAKPMAARLMTLARPGQILLSPIAEPLVHRASRELGERGDNLLWKSHGRWLFKGVPGAQEIHEVGEAGIAPLRMPKNGPKAWRDLPFWRRPKSLVAEAALLAAIGFGAWFFTRPEPAIAFAERDWVVVGDMRNLTGDERLDESLEQAFRISLEQSRYVNVLSDLKARETLQRMQKPEDTTLDRGIASEIALRDGARAVILPTVSEVGGRLRVSAEVVDPNTQATVYAETADGRGIGSALDSVDDVTGALREKLGEAMASIQQDSKPLPQVTTGNIEALRAYALGINELYKWNPDGALQFFKQAIQIDPGFTLAEVGIARAYLSSDDLNSAQPYIRSAAKNAANLTRKDRLYVEAWAASFGSYSNMQEKWQVLGAVYPDFYSAHMNYALTGWQYGNDYSGSEKLKTAADSPKNPIKEVFLATLAYLQLGMGKPDLAQKSINQAARSNPKIVQSVQAMVHSIKGDRRSAELAWNSGRQTNNPMTQLQALVQGIAIAINDGDLPAAEKRLALAQALGPKLDPAGRLHLSVIEAQVSLIAGKKNNAARSLHQAFELASKDKLPKGETGFSISNRTGLLAAAGLIAARSDQPALSKSFQQLAANVGEPVYPAAQSLVHLLRVENQNLKQPAKLAALKAMLDGHELIQTRVAIIDALGRTGSKSRIDEHRRWLASHRSRAFVEGGGNNILLPLNVADVKRLLD